jgi:hypothetical protein
MSQAVSQQSLGDGVVGSPADFHLCSEISPETITFWLSFPGVFPSQYAVML